MKISPYNIQHFFSAVKMRKNVEKFDIFLIFAQNTDCGYMLEPTVSVLEQKFEKYEYPCKPKFLK